MIVTVSANSVSVTMTEIPAPAFAIPGVGMSVVDSQASKLNITGPSAASTMATVPAQTNTAQTNTAAISGPSGVFIGVVGIVAGLSALGVAAIVVSRRKRKKKEAPV